MGLAQPASNSPPESVENERDHAVRAPKKSRCKGVRRGSGGEGPGGGDCRPREGLLTEEGAPEGARVLWSRRRASEILERQEETSGLVGSEDKFPACSTEQRAGELQGPHSRKTQDIKKYVLG